MKKWMIISLLLMAIVAISSVSYAWFTYVQRKSLVKLTSHEIEVSLTLGNDILGSSLVIEGISYIDFDKEVMNKTSSQGFNEVGQNYIINFHVSESSPLVKVLFNLEHNHPELLILLIDEGIKESENEVYVTDYHAYLKQIGSAALTKEEFLLSIDAHNEQVVNQLKTVILKPGNIYQIQMVLWADYDLLGTEDNYLTKTYTLNITCLMVNGKGDFDEN
jgi:hypothetical protein